MNDRRILTIEEADLLQEAAERWLRLRDVELNPGECAAAIVAGSELQRGDSPRRDVASLGRTIMLEVPGRIAPVLITLVRPGDHDHARGHMSILSDIGLACIGRHVASKFYTPLGNATLIGFADTLPFFGAGEIADGRVTGALSYG